MLVGAGNRSQPAAIEEREEMPVVQAGTVERSINGGRPASRAAIAAWCLFDWANSSYPTVIVTFVFAAYVTTYVAPSEASGTAAWGTAISLSALGVALLSPVLGAIADHAGPRKPWIFLLSLICVVLGCALWWVEPDPAYLLFALILVAVSNAAFEFGQVFYNAMLPDIAPHEMLGRVSGWAWACGYAGGIVALAVCLFVFALPEQPPFGLDSERFEEIRITGPLIAIWYAIFAAPMFLLTPDRPAVRISPARAIKAGVATLVDTLRQLPRYGNIARFLLARMFYIDGLNTLFAFGGIYAAGTFNMSFQEILAFGILLNVTAGLGAFGFAWVDDLMGSKPTILIAVASLAVCGLAILLVDSKLWFYVIGALLGVFIGPAQAASRTLMARLAPADMRTEMFGLYAFSGRATAFLGPAIVGWTTAVAESQRVGMSTILVFFLIGLILMLPVREKGAA